MHRTAEPSSRRFAFQPLAIAAAAALVATAGVPAQAQTFTQSGANSTSGNPSGLPFVGNPASLNFGTDTINIANSAPGSFSASAGAQLTAGGLTIANGGVTGVNGSTGNVTFSGAGTKVDLGGNDRVTVGAWGVGTMTVSGGALVDGTLNPGNCTLPGAFCNNFIGNAAGSTGTLTITGTDSELRVLRNFYVGHVAVFTNPPNSFTFGTPGGTTNAFVNVLAGGTLRSESTVLADAYPGPDSLGGEKSFAEVVIDGAGSRWIVTRNSVDNTAALMGIGSGAGANGLVTVSGGGKLHIDGTGSSGPNDGINIGSNGKGKLTVTGVSSQLLTTGVNTFINVGANNSLGDGSFELLAGATASTLYMNVGRNGGKGVMLIDGGGSTLTQSGVGTVNASNTGGPSFASIGRNGSSGAVTVSNGGQWLISDGGGDSRTAGGSPGIALGGAANATGSLTITGNGSKVEISTTSLNPGAGGGDNYNPFFAVGFDNAATSSGALTISAGGKLVMTGNAVSTVANPRGTQLNIGGRSGTAASGTATVTGAGSEILMSGYDAFINVGREAGSVGTLNVFAGGKVSSTSLAVGISATGTVNIDNAWIALSGTRTNVDPPIGAGTTIGRGTGSNGTLNMSNGARLTIDSTASIGGMAVGGDQFLGGGSGTVTMSGGSSIVFGGPLSGNSLLIGQTGIGVVSLSGGSRIDVGATGFADLGRSPGGDGTLTLASASKFTANIVNIGGRSDSTNAGKGTASVTGAGSELIGVGGFVGVGLGIGGKGTLTVSDGGKASSISMSVGRAGGTGTLNVTNASIDLIGQQTVAVGGVPANLTIGLGGGTGGPGTGFANFVGSTINIANNAATNANGNGPATATLDLGGRFDIAGGTGTLAMQNSQINVSAANGLASATIGRTGTGTATLQGSSITVSDGSSGNGSVFVARELGSTGTLNLSGNSIVNAGFVGIGVGSAGVGNALGAAGGTATLTLNDSTINTSRFELGVNGLLTGNNGTIDAGLNGPVVIGGTISPGNSPGRLRVKCDVTMLSGSKLILEISDTDGRPGVDFDIDQLIIGDDSKFDLTSLQIIFSFIGSTNPNAFAASPGGFSLDKFLLASAPDDTILGGLSSLFGNKRNPDTLNWGQAVNSQLFAFESSVYDVSAVGFNPETGKIDISAAARVPEPASIALVLLALAAMALTRRRRAARLG